MKRGNDFHHSVSSIGFEKKGWMAARIAFLLALSTASASALRAIPTMRARAPVSVSSVAMSATAETLMDASATQASPSTSIIRRVVSLPVTVPRAIWRRCTEEVCEVGRPRPLQFLKSLIPKRRPLVTVGRNECSVGIYKVERRDVDGAKQRVMVLYPLPRQQQQCASMEDAIEMF